MVVDWPVTSGGTTSSTGEVERDHLAPVSADDLQIYIEGAEQYASRDVDAGFVVPAPAARW
jgi:hypothetical protein